VYVPVTQVSGGMNAINNQLLPLQWVVRTNGEPGRLRAALEREITTAADGWPVGRVRTMEQVVAQAGAASDFNTTLLTIFAGIALVLAAIGLYGVVRYSVQQTREIGVRMAIGALPDDVLRIVLGEGLKLAFAGVALGLSLPPQ
jgi:putative ABC transport system permease protein